MKRIALLMFLVSLLVIVTINAKDVNNTGDASPSLNFLPDSIRDTVNGKRLLIYSYGHHGHNWCLIYQGEKSIDIRIGSTRATQPDMSSTIDTLKLLDSYQSLICWGMDSLPEMAKKMKPLYPKEWTPFYSSLSVYDSRWECIFDSNNANGFSGEGEDEVNKKYAALCYLMWWLSAPSIREYLPGFEQFEDRETNYKSSLIFE